jgi:hypothetical protein
VFKGGKIARSGPQNNAGPIKRTIRIYSVS